MDQNPTPDSPAAALEPAGLGSSEAAPLPELIAHALENSFTDSRRGRHDGWSAEKMRQFLEELATHGVVAEAARCVGMSAKSAYKLRARADGTAFHAAWEGALVLARRRLSDELFARSMNGCIEQIYNSSGSIVGERNRYDNRLSIAVLTRLDRQVKEMHEEARTGRAVAQDWERFLDIVEAGGEGAETFVAERLATAGPAKVTAMATVGGIPQHRDLHDLCPLCGAVSPASPASIQRLDPFEVWRDDDDCWVTNYPPPEGFDGEEEGVIPDDGYKRSLTAAEQAVVQTEAEAEREAELGQGRAFRDAWFGFEGR